MQFNRVDRGGAPPLVVIPGCAAVVSHALVAHGGERSKVGPWGKEGKFSFVLRRK